MESCTVQFFSSEENGKLVAVGTGILLKTDEFGYLVTTKHFWQEWYDKTYAVTCTGHRFNPQGHSIIIGMDETTHDHVDQAVIQLNPGVYKEVSQEAYFLHTDDLIIDFELDSTNNLNIMLFGYPNSKTKISEVKRNVLSDSYLYYTRFNFDFNFEKFGLNKHDNYALAYNKKVHRKFDNQTRILPLIEGMSGSGMWAFTDTKTHCMLLGILIERIYDHSPNQALICTRIDFALHAIIKYFEKKNPENEYFEKWSLKYSPVYPEE